MTRYSLFLMAMLGCIGCGQSGPTADIVDTVPAAGTVTYQGKLLEYHQVTFYPEGNRPAVGITDESGQFVLGTNSEGDGAVVGTHKATVSYVGPPETNPEAGMNDFSPPPPPPPKVKIPARYSNVTTSELTVDLPEDGNEDLKIELK